MNNLASAIKKFNDMLEKFPDDNKNTYEFYFFLKSLPMIRSENIPFVELGTILKHKKPVIFHELKALAQKNYIINIITSVDIDLQEAIKNINQIVEKGS